jgi:hypothetical protein
MLHNWSAGHFSSSRFVVVVCVLACFACVFFGLVVFFGFLVCDGIVTAFWTMYRSSTSYFLGPFNQQTAIYASIN